MRAAPETLPVLTGVDLGPDGYAVIRINKVLPREAVLPAQAQQDTANYVRAWVGAESSAYYNLLKERYKAQIRVPKPGGAATAER